MNVALLGGAGFLGRHLLEKLQENQNVENILVVDKLVHSLPRHSHKLELLPKVSFACFDISNIERLTVELQRHKIETVVHLAANADISKAVNNPTIDFVEGTALTQAALEASRLAKVKHFIFTSGSGVYGDNPQKNFNEETPFGISKSPYAASKIASETLIQTYNNMFGLSSTIFRMGNIVGPGQTHGVGIDFLLKLWNNPHRLQVLGDGYQRKPYIHVRDVVSGIIKLGIQHSIPSNQVFNLATTGGTLVRDIANFAIVVAGNQNTEILYGSTPQGWPGDIPVISMDSTKAKLEGWLPTYESDEAVRISLNELSNQRFMYI